MRLERNSQEELRAEEVLRTVTNEVETQAGVGGNGASIDPKPVRSPGYRQTIRVRLATLTEYVQGAATASSPLAAHQAPAALVDRTPATLRSKCLSTLGRVDVFRATPMN